MLLLNDSLDLSLAKVRDLQSTSTLEQFMAKLCLHHQRQIVDALGFLQTEVKAVASTCSPEPSASKVTLEASVETDCSPVPEQESAGLACTGQRAATSSSSSAKTVNDLLEAASPRNAKPWVPQQSSESAGPVDASGEVCPSQTRSDPLDLRKAASGDSRGSAFLLGKASEAWQEDLLLPEKKNSIRGHMYIEECYELKTIRTLSRRSATSDEGNCPAPVVETITLVAPKQALSKPESVPPVDVPFAGGCGETFGQKAPSEQPMEKEITGDVVEPLREADLMVETSQTGQPPFREKTPPHLQNLPSLRSATLLATATRGESEQKQVDCTFKARAEKTTPSQKRDFDPFGLQKLDLSAPNPPKFLEALRGEENQLQITSLNTKYDKMQRGWVQLDKEGQPAPRPRNRADRLKEIWKSKRRIRKPRPLDQQRYSPVQMLFMKTFDLTSICRWFLQTTETKSLVIVKKVNTRLPSETQLCFHSSSGVAGSSHGVFPSLQAERLKKHLKKFAVASPVKSNAKNQKLIAKAWEQDGPCSKGKEKIKEMTSATRISTKPYSNPRKTQAQPVESQKATAKSPASARILRKYTNIREKLHGQQHTLKPKEVVGDNLKSTCMKPSVPAKLISKPKALPEQAKKAFSTGKSSGKEPSGSKNSKAQSPPSSKREALNRVIKETGAKSGSSKLLMTLNRNNPRALKRAPPSVAAVAAKLRKPPTGAAPASPKLKQRVVMPRKVNAKAADMQKAEPVKAMQPKAGDPKAQAKTPVKSKPPESAAAQQLRADAAPLPSQDQVLTRSQRKMEATPPASGLPKPAAKRTQELAQTPAKRTRLSLLK
ncbi:hypothetical protein MATL_G00185130 [Megalops atlanticus]|uniref:Uncharacterized protein n=1 Tax=Megalops atlanticus TaxID=7932 RepID=A0A9D3SZM3_MEGAT|nr:hypothetical protein MATL_G00185130 [Megalops atlanticus]